MDSGYSFKKTFVDFSDKHLPTEALSIGGSFRRTPWVCQSRPCNHVLSSGGGGCGGGVGISVGGGSVGGSGSVGCPSVFLSRPCNHVFSRPIWWWSIQAFYFFLCLFLWK